MITRLTLVRIFFVCLSWYLMLQHIYSYTITTTMNPSTDLGVHSLGRRETTVILLQYINGKAEIRKCSLDDSKGQHFNYLFPT